MIYLEFIAGSVCQSDDLVYWFPGRDVHTTGKYFLKWLFLKNNPFNRISSLQFSSNRLLTFFATSYMSRKGGNGSRTPAVARPCDHVGELG
jgi:hypothetical protein